MHFSSRGIFSIGFMKANLILVDLIRLNYLGDTYNYLVIIQRGTCDMCYIDSICVYSVDCDYV